MGRLFGGRGVWAHYNISNHGVMGVLDQSSLITDQHKRDHGGTSPGWRDYWRRSRYLGLNEEKITTNNKREVHEVMGDQFLSARTLPPGFTTLVLAADRSPKASSSVTPGSFYNSSISNLMRTTHLPDLTIIPSPCVLETSLFRTGRAGRAGCSGGDPQPQSCYRPQRPKRIDHV